MILPSPWTFVVLAFAAFSIYVLLSDDFVLDGLRNRFAPDGSKLRDFLDCAWCCGFWTSGLVVIPWYMLLDEKGWDAVLGLLVVWFALRVAVVALHEIHTFVLLQLH